ncbi:tRNA (adenosine(37)-N6)-threonylcarbamoyltransferase complex dimerization subunit type 1 TsaB [Proteiniclasticum sp. C24MP]|uniref:tRNA (adenosine(37)-N6)-threonylcarbamoyltransferase complex dimerization subunit type 1 TsaB n=1 Tax=Proteiniclasticum sp. C24MP TaxID=3374101 RepID=UPI00375446E9
MKILSIDTSSNNCSVAVVDENAMLGEININYNLQHSVLLMPLIEELLTRLDLKVKDLGALTVSTGPGSFTGLRIGLSAVKGLALGSDLPVFASDALSILAYGVYGYGGVLVPMVDALRGGFYTGFYTFRNGKLITLMEPAILTLAEVKEKLEKEEKEILILGDIVDKMTDEELKFKENVSIAPSSLNIPRASSIPYLLGERIRSGESDDIHSLVPVYMRKSQAEYEYEKKIGMLK